MGSLRPPIPRPRFSPQQRLDLAQGAQIDFDLGVLELHERRDFFLPAFLAGGQGLPDERYVISGLPYKVDDILPGDLASTSAMEQCPGSTVAVKSAWLPAFALMLKLAEDLEGRNWAGSPVLNGANMVVGVYSRGVPGVDGGPSDGPAHAVAQIFHLTSFAADMLK